MPKKFKAKNGEPIVSKETAVVAPSSTAAQTDKKNEAPPALPVKLATKNDALGCVVVVDNNMTYFGTEDRQSGAYHWRVTYSPDRIKKLFDKVDAINADAAVTDKAKKISETLKSFTSPVPKVAWTHKLENAIPVAPAAVVVPETPVTSETPTV